LYGVDGWRKRRLCQGEGEPLRVGVEEAGEAGRYVEGGEVEEGQEGLAEVW